MSTLDRSQLSPPYPVYNEGGIEVARPPFGPPDLRPSGLGPGYAVYAAGHGRNLAGSDMENFDQKNSEGMEVYPNELNLLAQADDIDGNGVFDPYGTHGNIHPEDGIFQDHMSLPGDVARNVSYAESEVTDLTRPDGYTMYVPGGAVSFQKGQQKTYNDMQQLWSIPQSTREYLNNESIVDAPTAEIAVGVDTTEEEDKKKRAEYIRNYAIAAGAGLALGVAILMVVRKGKKR